MEPQEEHNEAEKGKRNMEKLFDLQVFAQENTQTTGGLSAEMKTYYGMELLDNAKPQLVHNQFAATKPLPTGGGKTVEWRKFGSFDKALTPLTEGVTPDGSGISVSYITKELAQYGDYTTVSDMLDLTAIDDVVLEITDRHGANMGLTLDTVTRNEIQQGKQVLYAPAIGADGGLHSLILFNAGFRKLLAQGQYLLQLLRRSFQKLRYSLFAQGIGLHAVIRKPLLHLLYRVGIIQ